MSDAAGGRITSFAAAENGLPPKMEDSGTGQGMETIKDVIFGSVAGMIGKMIEYPFDTVKVRLQSQPDYLSPRYTGPVDCFRQSIHAEGLRGLYRGISAPLVGAAIETSSLFFSYRIAQDVFKATLRPPTQGVPLPFSALVACGAASGAFTSLLLTPIELVKCQMQVPLSTSLLRRTGPFKIIASIIRHHGIFGLWHGQLGTLIRETGGSAAWFGSYEGVSALFRKHDTRSAASPSANLESKPPLPIYQQLLAGATAGVSYNFVFYPADTIKSRMQTEGVEPGSNVRRTFWASGKALWRQQGIKGMYRGCGITVVRAAPSSAFIFAIYEGLRNWWGRGP
ncbi:hypothetical protein N7G274_010015 [Stereocaulon virgatum]|uniref:Uncharacterized protein n=1 Tax=Stereocaulon virgatum TaxID=373712 RepID=A0ABR3ZXA1_9LECA